MVAQLREHQLGGYAGGHVSDHQAVVCCSIGERDGLRSRPGGRPTRSRGIGVLFHPGDSFTVPEDPVAKLLLPVSAPWLRFADAAACAREVAAGGGYAIHDAVLSEQGIGLVSNLLMTVARPGQEPFTQLG